MSFRFGSWAARLVLLAATSSPAWCGITLVAAPYTPGTFPSTTLNNLTLTVSGGSFAFNGGALLQDPALSSQALLFGGNPTTLLLQDPTSQQLALTVTSAVFPPPFPNGGTILITAAAAFTSPITDPLLNDLIGPVDILFSYDAGASSGGVLVGDFVELSNASAVPEPAQWGILSITGLGLMLTALRSRRRARLAN